jgi:hypothetical protein
MTISMERQPYLRDANYYRLAYQLSAQRINRAVGERWGEKADERFEEGLREEPASDRARLVSWIEEATAFAGEVQDVLAWYQDLERAWRADRWQRLRPARWRRRLPPKDQRLRQFLDTTVEPCISLLVAGAHVYGGRIAPAEQAADRIREWAFRKELSYRVHYNLACLDSMLVDASTRDRSDGPRLEAADGPDRDRLRSGIASLRRSFELTTGRRRGELVSWASDDPSLEALRSYDGERFRAVVSEFQGPKKRKQAA